MNQHLFWTLDSGQTWNEISPSMPTDAVIQDVQFINANNGWVLWTTSNPDDSPNFQLAHTTDNGKTWTINPLSLFQTGEIASFVEKAEIDWFDSQTGWISVKQSSGSNFSIGTLFTTSDGGTSWHRFPLPIADKIYFSDPQHGWAIGGPSGDQIFLTSDGGMTWIKVILPNISNDMQAKLYSPFIFNAHGLLVTTTFGTENSLNVYSLGKSEQWSLAAQVKLDSQPGQLALSILDSRNFVAAIPGTQSIVRMENGRLDVLKNKDGFSASIVSLDMISLEDGWAKSIDANCVSGASPDRESASVSCSSATRLLRTDNGGVTWQPVNLPHIQVGVASLNAGSTVTSSSITASGNTALFVGQGFDACEIPTLPQMQTWSQSSPYKVVNLYIGGSSRACNNTALISSYLFLLHQQGWDFIPTWVGPQAPCTGFPSRMSSDVNTSYTQGVNEADLAVDRLAQLGLTGPDKTGSVIYYDIENYGINAACRSAVNSFMNGWVSQLRVRGNMAGVYGSTLCNTGLSDFLSITNVPDVMWAARWYHNLGQGYYDPTASVWNLGSCIPNSAWANHQRVRQYEGDHNETWGNLTLEIDSDVLDGVVAVPYDYPNVSSITRADPDPTKADNVSFTVTFSKPVTGVNVTDFVLTASGVTEVSIIDVNGTGTSYTVNVDTGTGDGTIRLDVRDNNSIIDAANNPLGGFGNGDGNFTSGEIYSIIKNQIFRDVTASYWASDYIARLYNAGITSGCSTTPLMYCPETTVTRAEMAVFLLRGVHGSSYSPPELAGDTGFSDVPADYWAAAWIKELSAEGITSGCGNGKYCPEHQVTRDQMAVFLLRSKYGSSYLPPSVGDNTGFDDVHPDYWSAAWIKQLVTEGITAGCGNGNYCPATSVSRAQMAVFLVKTFNLP